MLYYYATLIQLGLINQERLERIPKDHQIILCHMLLKLQLEDENIWTYLVMIMIHQMERVCFYMS